MKLRAVALIILALATPATARRSPKHLTQWEVTGVNLSGQQIAFDRKGFQPLWTMRPKELFALEADAVIMTKRGPFVIPKGTMMIPSAAQRGVVCELLMSVASAFSCLKDVDGDDRYEARFGTQVFNNVFLGSIGDDGEPEALMAPVKLERLDPARAPKISLELKYRGLFRSTLWFDVCSTLIEPSVHIAKKHYYPLQTCMRELRIPISPTPLSASIFGSTVTLRTYDNKSAAGSIAHNPAGFVFTSEWKFP